MPNGIEVLDLGRKPRLVRTRVKVCDGTSARPPLDDTRPGFGNCQPQRADAAQAGYYDFGSSSECYCNDSFVELETLAPAATIAPDASAFHTETWELYSDIVCPENEDSVQMIVEKLSLE